VDDFVERYGPWALVTGAGNGLGAEFARQLAARALNVVIVDVDTAGLDAVAAELRGAFGVEIRTVTVDLTQADFMTPILAATSGLDVGLVINNAGISGLGLFQHKPLADHLAVVDVNVRAPLMLTHHFVPQLVQRGRGGLLFVSSLSALQGTAHVANYAATKAWNLIFAEGLWEELRDTGVDVLGYLVGSTRTPGFVGSRPKLDKARMVTVMEMSDTVRGALDGLGNGPVQVAGRGNAWSAALLSRLLPRKWAVKLVSATTRAMYG
jgi:uncharacterized protein